MRLVASMAIYGVCVGSRLGYHPSLPYIVAGLLGTDTTTITSKPPDTGEVYDRGSLFRVGRRHSDWIEHKGHLGIVSLTDNNCC